LTKKKEGILLCALIWRLNNLNTRSSLKWSLIQKSFTRTIFTLKINSYWNYNLIIFSVNITNNSNYKTKAKHQFCFSILLCTTSSIRRIVSKEQNRDIFEKTNVYLIKRAMIVNMYMIYKFFLEMTITFFLQICILPFFGMKTI